MRLPIGVKIDCEYGFLRRLSGVYGALQMGWALQNRGSSIHDWHAVPFSRFGAGDFSFPFPSQISLSRIKYSWRRV